MEPRNADLTIGSSLACIMLLFTALNRPEITIAILAVGLIVAVIVTLKADRSVIWPRLAVAVLAVGTAIAAALLVMRSK